MIAKPYSFEEYREIIEYAFSAFPDFNANVKDIMAKGDKVAVRWIFRGTHEGEYQGIPATGNKVELGFLTIIRFQEGKIVETWEEYDVLSAFQQLGMELKPKREK